MGGLIRKTCHSWLRRKSICWAIDFEHFTYSMGTALPLKIAPITSSADVPLWKIQQNKLYLRWVSSHFRHIKKAVNDIVLLMMENVFFMLAGQLLQPTYTKTYLNEPESEARVSWKSSEKLSSFFVKHRFRFSLSDEVFHCTRERWEKLCLWTPLTSR